MHRTPKLQDAARHLQQAFVKHNGSLSYAQALDVLGQLEGFEGFRQMKAFVAKHSQVDKQQETLTPAASPAPAAEMSEATYLALSTELEGLEMAHAKGQDLPDTYTRMAEIDKLLDASPWTRDMDTGEIVTKAAQRIAQGLWSNDVPY